MDASAGSHARSEQDGVSSRCCSVCVSVCVSLSVSVCLCVCLCVCVFLFMRLAMLLLDDQDGSTALLLACEHGHLDVARWLVTDAGSDARSERDSVSCRYRAERDRCAPIVT
jgi:ankyrin repeat protein